jgi:hypothetical protein
LSGHANLYDKYRIHSLIYRFKNLKGTDSDGNILMSFDYDTLDLPPSSAIEMTQATRWIDGSPWRIFELRVPSDGRILFTRSGAAAAADLKTYDMGRLFVAAEGCADTSDHGYLEVEYDIELIDKAPLSASPDLVPLTQFNQSSSGSTNPLPFDEEIVNGLGLDNTAGVVTLPVGIYLIEFEAGTSGASTFELEQGGASLVPPALSTPGSGATGVITRYLEIDSEDTIRIATSASYVADETRLTIRRL